MFLLVGLGNPEKKHNANRHNIGFMAADSVAEKYQFSPYRNRFQGFISEGKIGGVPIRILKPSTYMNESGRSVGEAVRFFKPPANNIYVFYDDLDLIPGKCRIKYGGGAGGHNGLRSLDAHIGREYWRVRLGIGHPGHKEKVLGHVLQDFTKIEQNSWLPTLMQSLADNIHLLTQRDENALMSKLASSVFPQNEKKLPKKTAEKLKTSTISDLE
jgi:PTH1 family peptidyl-tRNA hydrolase